MERPSETGRSKSASHQISIGLRRRAKMIERAPRGLSGRRGNGGTKSLEALEATGMANALERRCAQDLGQAEPPRQWRRREFASPDAIEASKRRALAHRRRQRAVIEVVKLAADRHAVSEPRHLDGVIGEEIDDVMRGRLALDSRVYGKDQFADLALGDARDQRRSS